MRQHSLLFVRPEGADQATVRVQRYLDGSLAIFHGPRKLADYHADGTINTRGKEIAA